MRRRGGISGILGRGRGSFGRRFEAIVLGLFFGCCLVGNVVYEDSGLLNIEMILILCPMHGLCHFVSFPPECRNAISYYRYATFSPLTILTSRHLPHRYDTAVDMVVYTGWRIRRDVRGVQCSESLPLYVEPCPCLTAKDKGPSTMPCTSKNHSSTLAQ